MSKTILVPLDGSTQAEAALPTASRFARTCGGTLLLLRVVPPPPYPEMILMAFEEEQAVASCYLETVASSQELAGLPVKTMTQGGEPASVILDVANSCHADLIVLLRYKTVHMIGKIIEGVVEKVISYATAPVLVLREAGPSSPSFFPAHSHTARVLVPLDGSIFARAALLTAITWLTQFTDPRQRRALHLVKVVKPLRPDQEDEMDFLQHQRAWLRAQYYLSQVKEHVLRGEVSPLVESRKIDVDWSVVCDADIAGALVRMTEPKKVWREAATFGECDLIAMSTHGKEGRWSFPMGSITQQVLRTAWCPLLIVHPGDLIANERSWAVHAPASRLSRGSLSSR